MWSAGCLFSANSCHCQEEYADELPRLLPILAAKVHAESPQGGGSAFIATGHVEKCQVTAPYRAGTPPCHCPQFRTMWSTTRVPTSATFSTVSAKPPAVSPGAGSRCAKVVSFGLPWSKLTAPRRLIRRSVPWVRLTTRAMAAASISVIT